MSTLPAVMAQQLGPIDTPAIDWLAISPPVALLAGSLLILTLVGVTRWRPAPGVWAAVTVVTSLVAIGLAAAVWVRVTDPERGPSSAVAGAVAVDGFTVFVTVVVCVAVILTAMTSAGYLRREGLDGPELYALLLLAGTGGIVMAAAGDLIVLFLGLEILSIAVYVLAGYHLRRIESQESAMKYFVLGAFSSAFLLYGIALVYGATGSTNLARIADFLAGNVLESTGLLLAGFALLLVGLGFKVAAAPFHVWVPDVYQGAPTPITGFMAAATKAAAFAALVRVFVSTFGGYQLDWQPIVGALAVLTLVVGAVLAAVQTDLKRTLAYTSLVHAGFILVAVQTATDQGVVAVLFYSATYAVVILGMFAVLTTVSRRGDVGHDLDAYRGMAYSRPGLALALTLFLMAQAGIPLTAGFFAKFYVIAAAVDAGTYLLAVAAMLGAVVAAFVYLRLIVTMYSQTDEQAARTGPAPRPVRPPIPLGVKLTLAVAVVYTLAAGILPGPLVDLARDATPLLVLAG